MKFAMSSFFFPIILVDRQNKQTYNTFLEFQLNFNIKYRHHEYQFLEVSNWIHLSNNQRLENNF